MANNPGETIPVISNPLGTTTKRIEKIKAGPVMPDSTLGGFMIGTLFSFIPMSIFSVGIVADPIQFFAVLAGFGISGSIASETLVSSLSMKSKIRDQLHASGFRTKDLKFSGLRSFKEKRTVLDAGLKIYNVENISEFTVVNNIKGVWLERTMVKPAIESWDEAMETVKNVYGVEARQKRTGSLKQYPVYLVKLRQKVSM